MKKLLVLLIFAPQLLWAAPVTEFIYQADEAMNMIRPQFGTQVRSTEIGTTTQDTTGFGLDVEYQYGLAANHSVGGTLGFTSATTEVTNVTNDIDQSGLNDVGVIYRGRLPFEGTNWTMRWGADAAFALENIKNDATGAPTNTASGRSVFTPYVGADTVVAKFHTLGARVSSQFALTDTTQESNAGVETTWEGNESTNFDVYWEMDNDTWKLVGVLGYQNTSEFSQQNAATPQTYSRDFLNVRALVPFYFGDNSAVLPQVIYSNIIGNDNPTQDVTGSIFNLTVAYRQLF